MYGAHDKEVAIKSHFIEIPIASIDTKRLFIHKEKVKAGTNR